MIKAIAFDFVGVFLKENNFELTPTEQILERQFGNINTDPEFLKWAQLETKLPPEENIKSIQYILQNIYEIREPDIFSKIPKLKFSTATNHLSYVTDWFKTLPISKNFQYFVNSATAKAQKPDPEFYKILINTIGEKPEDILFIDDKLENCLGAQKCGLKTLHFRPGEVLSQRIIETIKISP